MIVLKEEPKFNANDFVTKILKEIPFFEVIPLPSYYNNEIVFNVKTKNLNEASRIFYKNGIAFTTIVLDNNETYLEANIKVEIILD